MILKGRLKRKDEYDQSAEIELILYNQENRIISVPLDLVKDKYTGNYFLTGSYLNINFHSCNKINDITPRIFCYTEEWQKGHNEILELLRDI